MASITFQFQRASVLENDCIQVISKSTLFNFKRSNAIIKIFKDQTQVKEGNARNLIDNSKPYQSVIEIDYPFNRNTRFDVITVVVENISDEDTKHLTVALHPISLTK